MDLWEKEEIMGMLSAAACESKHKILADTVYAKDRRISHYAVDYVHGETVIHIVKRMQELLDQK